MNSVPRWMGQAAVASLLAVVATTAGAALKPEQAAAQVAYGSYVGIGAGVGFTNDAATGEGSNFQGIVTGRYRFLTAPISVRAQAMVFGSEFAFVPTVSYDFPSTGTPMPTLGLGCPSPVAAPRLLWATKPPL